MLACLEQLRGGRPEHNFGSHFGLLLPSSSAHSSGQSSEYRLS